MTYSIYMLFKQSLDDTVASCHLGLRLIINNSILTEIHILKSCAYCTMFSLHALHFFILHVNVFVSGACVVRQASHRRAV